MKANKKKNRKPRKLRALPGGVTPLILKPKKKPKLYKFDPKKIHKKKGIPQILQPKLMKDLFGPKPPNPYRTRKPPQVIKLTDNDRDVSTSEYDSMILQAVLSGVQKDVSTYSENTRKVFIEIDKRLTEISGAVGSLIRLSTQIQDLTEYIMRLEHAVGKLQKEMDRKNTLDEENNYYKKIVGSLYMKRRETIPERIKRISELSRRVQRPENPCEACDCGDDT